MSSKAKGSVVLAMVLFLGSAPTWAVSAGSAEGRPHFSDSSVISAFSAAVSGWLDSVLHAGHTTVQAIWGEYGIAIDPDGQPQDPTRSAEAGGGTTSTL